jgi:receptor protein-tyrosine kinase
MYSDHSASRQEWNGGDCVRILYRRKATLLCLACLGFVAAALIAAIAPRVFQSRASLEVQTLNDNFLNLRDIYPTTAPSADVGIYMQTQAELMQQDALIEQAASRLHREGRPGFLPSAASLDTLRKAIRVVPLRNSRIIQIVCDARDAQAAADLANTLAEISIAQSIETRQRSARQTYESLQPQLDSLRYRLLQSHGAGKPAWGSELEVLAPGVEADRPFYEAMLRKANDARMASVVRQSNIRLISPAEPATRPYKPNLPLILAIGTFGGLVLAIGCVMLQEQNDSVLRMPGEAGMYLTLPELGAIPKAACSRISASAFPYSRNGSPRVGRATLDQPSSSLSESFRTTLASILSARCNGDQPSIFVVTSSRPMEGKTTVVSNLGTVLAEISNKVLLIDGDMRHPQLHRVFDQSNSWGLSDILREKNAIDELPMDVLVKKTNAPHLYVLPSGASTDNIFGLLNSGRMSRLLQRFREEFDYVLVDAPPCLEFADARIMARYAEGLLLVVRASYTDRRTARAAVERLQLDRIPVMGVILNRWDPARSDMYGYRAYTGVSEREIS